MILILHHILTACPNALAKGRYTWRHNKVLQELADMVEKHRKDAKTGKKNQSLYLYLLGKAEEQLIDKRVRPREF